jgi:hypothetical protein
MSGGLQQNAPGHFVQHLSIEAVILGDGSKKRLRHWRQEGGGGQQKQRQKYEAASLKPQKPQGTTKQAKDIIQTKDSNTGAIAVDRTGRAPTSILSPGTDGSIGAQWPIR